MRKSIWIAVAVLVLVSALRLAWAIGGLPRATYYFRYGPDPYCDPTGEALTVEGITFIEIGPGIARIGSTFRARGGNLLGRICEAVGLPWGSQPVWSNEMPVRWVEFPNGFWIAQTETTNAQFERFVGPRYRADRSLGDHHPATRVAWAQAQAYCQWLGEKVGKRGRLPREAEWECACRAGNWGKYCFGDDWQAALRQYANFYNRVHEGGAIPVAQKKPNAFGLYDMHGNVAEYCEDAYSQRPPVYGDSPRPWTPGARTGPAVRSGHWNGLGGEVRSACRWNGPRRPDAGTGFRPLLENEP